MMTLKHMPCVAVLMSTYNGEKYIKQQIESILNQENVDVTLFIRDDGSTDGTLDIISLYSNLNNVVFKSEMINLGPGQSFLRLLYLATDQKQYEYYAFADQDDIWFPKKLSTAISYIQEYSNMPVLYGSNQIIYKNNRMQGMRYNEHLDLRLERLISKNPISGCTMVFNQLCANRVTSKKMPPDDIIDYKLHDAWLILVACVTGLVIYDTDSYIMYRIHSENTVGLSKPGILDMIKRIFKIGNGKTRRCNIRMKTAGLLLEYYPDMKIQQRKVLEKYAYYQESFMNKCNLFMDDDLIEASGEKSFMFKLKILMNFI